MLGDTPVVVLRPADHMVDDAARALAPGFVASDVRHGQERLDRVHVGVEASIRVKLGEILIPGVHGQVNLVIPETLEEHVLRVGQQFSRAGAAQQRGRRGGEQYKGVRIALLGANAATFGGNGRIPAAVRVVMQFATQAAQAGIDQRLGARMTHECCQRVHMRHAAGNPRLAVAIPPWSAVIAQPIRTTARRRESVAEVHKIIALLVEPRLVFRDTKRVFGFNLHLLHPFMCMSKELERISIGSFPRILKRRRW